MRTGARKISDIPGGSASGCSELFFQSQSPTIANADNFSWSDKMISPLASSVARSGRASGVWLTVTATDFPSVRFSWPASSGSSAAKSLVSSWRIAGVSPSVIFSRASKTALSIGEKANVRPFGSALSGQRPPPHFASTTSINFPRATACSKFGGKIKNSSAGSPDAARSSDGFFFATGFTIGGTGAAAFFCASSQCNPTATPCAQIFPHCRASRQVQRFSISIPFWMTIEARMELPSACTTPRSSGGAQYELTTSPCSRWTRARFITSQPAALLKSDSVSSTDISRAV